MGVRPIYLVVHRVGKVLCVYVGNLGNAMDCGRLERWRHTSR